MTVSLPLRYRGKVRDLYDVDDEHILMVASDRLSAFDVVMAEPVPDKGRVLTAFTSHWLTGWGDTAPASLVSCDPGAIEELVPGFATTPEWHGRATLVRRATMIPLEFIVRARLAGSAFEEYKASGTVHHMAVPAGMALTDAFPTAMLTPSAKNDVGHDRNIDLAEAADIVGPATLARAEEICLDLFARATKAMEQAGLILADTKFELGVVDGDLVVCDEVITPDSSRIWPAGAVVSGETPPSFDKQPFRDWLATLPWDRTPPPPSVPDDVITVTSARYVAAYENVTGKSLRDWYGQRA